MGVSWKFSKRDRNQPELVSFAESIGMSCREVHYVPGALDLIVGCYRIDRRVEVKDPQQVPSQRKLTKPEREEFERWKGHKPDVWLTDDDVMQTRREMLAESVKVYGIGVPG